MSKPSHRPTRESRKFTIEGVKKTRKQLRELRQATGLLPPKRTTISNSKSPYQTLDEEKQAREESVKAQLGVYRSILPKLLKQLSKIPDPRNPKKVKHQFQVLMLFGILSALFQMSSRREANRQLSMASFFETLHTFFPELESCPHADTLNRLLSRIEIESIQEAHLDFLNSFMRKKKFRNFLVKKNYLVAIDGTQKLSRDGVIWGGEWLRRSHQTKDGEKIEEYVYVLEANLVFNNGMSIPLLTEFLSMSEGDPSDKKQDCELRAFYRLALRLKNRFPKLRITLLLDGLYPNGPLIYLCLQYHWDFMIVLPDKCLLTVWQEYESLRQMSPKNEATQSHKGREQSFCWINGIDYQFKDEQNKQHSLLLNVVVCHETWEEIDPQSGEIVQKRSKHAWLSSEEITRGNLHCRCNLMARRRWAIETSMLIEKKQGYCYEHLFSLNFQAMKGFHYLMRIAHAINEIARFTKEVAKKVAIMGLNAFFSFVKETCANRWLSRDWIEAFLEIPFRIAWK